MNFVVDERDMWKRLHLELKREFEVSGGPEGSHPLQQRVNELEAEVRRHQEEALQRYELEERIKDLEKQLDQAHGLVGAQCGLSFLLLSWLLLLLVFLSLV